MSLARGHFATQFALAAGLTALAAVGMSLAAPGREGNAVRGA
jgi:hypothetical protein